MERDAEVSGRVLQAYFEPVAEDGPLAELVVVRKTGCQVFVMQDIAHVTRTLELPHSDVSMATRYPGSDLFYLATEGVANVRVMARRGLVKQMALEGVPSGLWANKHHLVVTCVDRGARHLLQIYSLDSPEDPKLCFNTWAPQNPCVALHQTHSGSLLALPSRDGVRLVEVAKREGCMVIWVRDVLLDKGLHQCHAFSRDASMLAGSRSEGTIVALWKVLPDNGGLEKMEDFNRGHEEADFHGADFDQSSKLLAWATSRPTCHVFDVNPDTRGQVHKSTQKSYLTQARELVMSAVGALQESADKGNVNLPTSKYQVSTSLEAGHVACCLRELQDGVYLALVRNDGQLTIHELLETKYEPRKTNYVLRHTHRLDPLRLPPRNSNRRDDAGRRAEDNDDENDDQRNARSDHKDNRNKVSTPQAPDSDKAKEGRCQLQ